MTHEPAEHAPSPWDRLRAFTPARIGLGRAGVSLPTAEVLRFGWAHAQARDAVHTPLDAAALQADLAQAGWPSVVMDSQAADRTTYLLRPDLGRQLSAAATQQLLGLADGVPAPTLAFVIGDGLSPLAVQRHAVPLLQALHPRLDASITCSPVVVVRQARVAVADAVGELLRARLAVILIGERPGLSSPDSLGIYLTHDPRRGRHDAQRNCISNVRPEGLSYDAAAHKLAWLVHAALRRGLTGVQLKDESDAPALDTGAAGTVLPAD